MCLAANNFGLQEENINMGYHRQIERQMDRKREKEAGRIQCFTKKEDKSPIDVENVETTGEKYCHLS